MATEHPNVSLVRRVGKALAERDLDDAAGLFADDFVWHYFNPRLPDIAGDYAGGSGVGKLFEKRARPLASGGLRLRLLHHPQHVSPR